MTNLKTAVPLFAAFASALALTAPATAGGLCDTLNGRRFSVAVENQFYYGAGIYDFAAKKSYGFAAQKSAPVNSELGKGIFTLDATKGTGTPTSCAIVVPENQAQANFSSRDGGKTVFVTLNGIFADLKAPAKLTEMK